jgi:hypothetical protein
MIAVGSILCAPTGRYRLMGYQPDGRLNLQDLRNLTAFILRHPSRIDDLELEAEPTGLEVLEVLPPSRTAPALAVPPLPTTSSERAPCAFPYIQHETLGAVRPGGSLCTCPGIETYYWRPCLTFEGGEPHCFFIASNFNLNLYCPACRRFLNRIVDPLQIPKALMPWGDGEPIWDLVGGARGQSLFAWYEERSAIMEYEGGMTRARAQDSAYRLLLARMQGSLFD